MHAPLPSEEFLSDQIRHLAVEEISNRPTEEVCALLGLTQGGLETLLWETHWRSLAESFRVAILLDLPITREIMGLVADAVVMADADPEYTTLWEHVRD